jgi:hypothetical protein
MARRDRTGSIDLTPHPLTIVQSKKQVRISLTKTFESAPPPVPPRARSMTTSRLLSRPVPPPLLSSKSDKFPLSLRTTSISSAGPPRSTSVSHLSPLEETPTNLPTSVQPTRRIVSAQCQQSKPGPSILGTSSLSLSLTDIHPANRSSEPRRDGPQIARSATAVQLNRSTILPQDTTPPSSPEKQKADYFSLIHRRPKAPRPLPLNLSSAEFGPLIPGLLTPPPDVPLPPLPAGHHPKRSPSFFTSYLSWSSSEKKCRDVHSKPGSLSSASARSEKMVPGEMNWI